MLEASNDTAISIISPSVMIKLVMIFIPACVLLGGLLVHVCMVEINSDLAVKKDHEMHLINIGESHFRDLLVPIVEDLEFIAGLVEKTFGSRDIDFPEGPERRTLESSMLIFANAHHEYDQIRFIDTTGWEVVRINNTTSGALAVKAPELQSKPGRYYFKEAIALGQGEIYFSPMDLNIEKGEIELPLKPMIRIARPVFNQHGMKMGIVILNYFSATLIDRLEKPNQNQQSVLMLLDSNGYWLKAESSEDEWGFMFPHKMERTFGNRYPKVWETVDKEMSGQVESKEGLFSFTTVYPLKARQPSLPGADGHGVVRSSPAGRDYHWTIVSYLPSAVLYAKQRLWRLNGSLFGAVMVLALGFISWRFAWLSTVRQEDELKLRDAKAELETRVLERTEDLERANRNLSEEIELKNEARNALMESETNYRSMMASMAEEVYICSENHTIDYMNPALFKKIGRDVTGQTCYKALYNQEHVCDWCTFPGVRADRFSCMEFSPPGSGRYLKASASAITRREGSLALLNIVSDITQQKEQEKARLESDGKFRILVETMLEGLIIIDQGGHVTYANEQLAQMLNAKRDDLIGQHYASFFNDTNLALFENQLAERRQGIAVPYEITWKTSGADGVDTLVSPAILYDDNGQYQGSFGIVSDITSRKKTDKYLKLSQARLGAMLELNTMEDRSENELAVFALEQGVRLTESFGGYFHFYDETLGTILLTSWSETILEMCSSAAGTHYALEEAGVWADCIRTRGPVIHNDYPGLDTRKGYPDGHFPVMRHMSIPVYDGNRIIAIAGVGNKETPYDHSDVEQLTLLMSETWRIISKKRAKTALTTSEDKYRTLFETMGQGVISQDAEGNIIAVNPAAELIIGASLDQMTQRFASRHPLKLIREDGIELAEEDHPSMIALKTGREVKNAIVGIHTPAMNDCVWLKVDAVPQFMPGSTSPYQVYTILDDITEARKAAKQLKESEAKHRSMMEAMDDPAYICSKDYVVSYQNPAMTQWLGCNVVGESCYASIYGLESRCSWCVFDSILKGKHSKYTVINPRDSRHYHISNSPLAHSDGTLSKFTIFRDITETLNLEKQLRHLQKLEAIGTLAGGIAHDFNNILSAIMGYVDLVMNSVDRESTQFEDLEEVMQASLRAKELVQQILTFSRQTEQEMRPVRIGSIVAETLKLLRASLPSTIEINSTVRSKSQILGDPTQIHQVIMNLCTNAAHSMMESGGTMTIELTADDVDTSLASRFVNMPAGHYLHLTVSDTGHGIRKEDLDRIFEPFYTTKPEGEGSGLGLSLVHGIVKNHKGQIQVISDWGKGTCFHVYFPAIEPTSSAPPVHTGELPGGNEKILIVDDEVSILRIYTRILRALGYTVEAQGDPLKALERLQQDPLAFDLVISDMTMPRMTGDQLSEKLLKINPGLPIIVCTGFAEKINQEKAEHIGIRSVLMKPVIKSELAVKVRSVLDSASVLK